MKKLLNTLYILTEDAYLTLDGECIVIKSQENGEKKLPLCNFENIYCFNYAGCSPALMGKCCENGIGLSFYTPNGKYLARVQGTTRGNIFLRKAQFEQFAEPSPILSQNTVAAKLSNTRYLLRRTMRDNQNVDDDGALSRCIEYLEKGIDNAYNTVNTEALMGIEGNCAKEYFSVFNKLILHQKEDFKLTSRTKRPPLDPVNAMLSFLYSIMTNLYTSALEGVGLDSFYGFYHALRPGRSSLSCDLMEETRCIAERLVITLINLKKIKAKDFDYKESGAVMLNDSGRKVVLTAWREREQTEIIHPYLKEKVKIGLIPFIQSSLLAKYIRGEIEEYPCFLMK